MAHKEYHAFQPSATFALYIIIRFSERDPGKERVSRWLHLHPGGEQGGFAKACRG